MNFDTITEDDWNRATWRTRRAILDRQTRQLRDLQADLERAMATLAEAEKYRPLVASMQALNRARKDLERTRIEARRHLANANRDPVADVPVDPLHITAQRRADLIAGTTRKVSAA